MSWRPKALSALDPNLRTAIARHESGHALLMLLLGLPLARVTIFEDYRGTTSASGSPPERQHRDAEQTSRVVRVRMSDPVLTFSTLRDRALVLGAGAAAQDPFAPLEHWDEASALAFGASSDRDQLRDELALSGYPGMSDEWWRAGVMWARRVVDARWGAVLAVAQELDTRGQLSGDEVCALVATAPRLRNNRPRGRPAIILSRRRLMWMQDAS